MKGFTVLPNDIIVSCAGTIGETYILPSSAEIGIINQALMRMRITSQINVDYFLIYFDYMVKETARESSKGSAIKNIPPFDIFKKIILPLPPLKRAKTNCSRSSNNSITYFIVISKRHTLRAIERVAFTFTNSRYYQQAVVALLRSCVDKCALFQCFHVPSDLQERQCRCIFPKSF